MLVKDDVLNILHSYVNICMLKKEFQISYTCLCIFSDDKELSTASNSLADYYTKKILFH